MRRSSRMALVVAAVTSLAMTGVASGRGALPGQAGQSEVTVSPSTAAPGDTVTFSGAVARDPGECQSVTVTSTADLFPPDGFGPQAPLAADDTFRTTYAVPATAPAGSYHIGLRCGGGNVGVQATLVVAAPAGPPATPVEAEPHLTG